MKCAVEHCQSVARAKSLCNKHYQRAAKGEDPNAVLVYDLSPAERLAAKTSKTATFGVSKTHIQRIRTGRARVGVSDV